MAGRLWFLVAICGLFATATCFIELPEFRQLVDARYNRTIQTVVDILWKSFETEIRSKFNALFFTIPSAIDIDFLTQVLDKELKEKVLKSLPLYETFHEDLERADDFLRSREMHFRTIFYGQLEEMKERMLIGHAFSMLSKSSNRFQLIVNNMKYPVKKWQGLSSAVKESGLGVTCGVRFCDYPIILHEKAPFAIFTLATWNITSDMGFTWTEKVEFALSETSSTRVSAVRSVAKYDYAEFQYPTLKNCAGRVLRLPYNGHNWYKLDLIFVIPSAEKTCSSSEELWKNVQNVNLRGLRYKSRSMFVSIPLFNVSANIDLKMKLKETALKQAFDEPSSRLDKALAFQAAEVMFNPTLPEPRRIPSIALRENSTFKVERPFFFALFHKLSETPIFAGLVNNPGCTRKCHEAFDRF